MNRGSRWFVAVVLVMLSVSGASTLHAAARKQTFTGEIGDAMCGRKHMDGTPAECTRTCVAHGSNFALIVGEKIYILQTSDKSVLATFDKQAGKTATVTGVLADDTMEVSSVAAK
jgi:hypothetical protein